MGKVIPLHSLFVDYKWAVEGSDYRLYWCVGTITDGSYWRWCAVPVLPVLQWWHSILDEVLLLFILVVEIMIYYWRWWWGIVPDDEHCYIRCSWWRKWLLLLIPIWYDAVMCLLMKEIYDVVANVRWSVDCYCLFIVCSVLILIVTCYIDCLHVRAWVFLCDITLLLTISMKICWRPVICRDDIDDDVLCGRTWNLTIMMKRTFTWKWRTFCYEREWPVHLIRLVLMMGCSGIMFWYLFVLSVSKCGDAIDLFYDMSVFNLLTCWWYAGCCCLWYIIFIVTLRYYYVPLPTKWYHLVFCWCHYFDDSIRKCYKYILLLCGDMPDTCSDDGRWLFDDTVLLMSENACSINSADDTIPVTETRWFSVVVVVYCWYLLLFMMCVGICYIAVIYRMLCWYCCRRPILSAVVDDVDGWWYIRRLPDAPFVDDTIDIIVDVVVWWRVMRSVHYWLLITFVQYHIIIPDDIYLILLWWYCRSILVPLYFVVQCCAVICIVAVFDWYWYSEVLFIQYCVIFIYCYCVCCSESAIVDMQLLWEMHCYLLPLLYSVLPFDEYLLHCCSFVT